MIFHLRRAALKILILKKTKCELEQESRRTLKRSRIVEIRGLLDEKHYSERATALALGVSRNTVRRVREGDIEVLCQTNNRSHSKLDQYITPITEWLIQGKKFTEIRNLLKIKYYVNMSMTQVSFYCARIKAANGRCVHKIVPCRYVSRQDVFQHIWSGLDINNQDWCDVCEKYPHLPLLEMMICSFRGLLGEHSVDHLVQWMKLYENSHFAHINSFVHGLKRDWNAVSNSLLYSYNSGFVEGTVNKLKTTKRAMYGRASYALLRAKLLVPYYQNMIS